jgi:WhiB family transcriptional regulator, redox-sensing transcriptional regulator
MCDNVSGSPAPDMPEAVTPGFLGSWSQRAICAGEDPEIFFPTCGDPGAAARKVCANCPVRLDCLEYAIDADEVGIWGGLDQEERRNLQRERLKSA